MSEFGEGEKKEPVFSDPDVPAEVMAWAVDFERRSKSVPLLDDVARNALYDEEDEKMKDSSCELALALVRKSSDYLIDRARDAVRLNQQKLEYPSAAPKAQEILRLSPEELVASRLNLLIDEEGTIRALAELGGHHWARDSRERTGSGTIKNAIEQLRGGSEIEPISAGYLRFYTAKDGSMQISLSHIPGDSRDQSYNWTIVKAKELGFGIHR